MFTICSLTGGGAEKVLVDVLNNFDYDRFEVDVCLVYNKGIYRNQLPGHIKQLSIFPFCPGLFFRLVRLLYLLRLTKVYAWYVNRRLPDAYDTGIAFLEGMATQCLYLKKNVGRKLAWVHVDLFTYHWTKKDFPGEGEENEAYRSMDGLVFVADDTRICFNKRFPGIDPRRQHVIYDPVDKEQVIRKSLERDIVKEKTAICSVGRLSPQKGYDRLIHVCCRLKEAGFDFELWIVGAGDEKENLEKLSRSLGMGECIRFTGFVSNPYPFIRCADVYVSSSVSEGFSLVVAEALCLGKAIVSTCTAGPRELLLDGEYGLLTDNAEDALFEGLKSMLADPALRRQYAGKALAGSAQFDLQHSVGQITSLIEGNVPFRAENHPEAETRPLLSIVVPVYNVEPYLEKCLASLLDQDMSHGEYEVIIVDDGSTDNSGRIVAKFCETYPLLIKSARQENKGLSEARNAGLDIATGRYIWFVDSDDRIEKPVLKELVGLCLSHDLDMLDFRFHRVDESGNQIACKKYLPSFAMDRVVDGAEYLNGYTFESGVWHYLFSHDFLRRHRLRFVPGIYHEDEEFTARSVFFASRIQVVENTGYYYLVRENSIITTKDKTKRQKKLRDLVSVVHSLNALADSNRMTSGRRRRRGIKKRTRMHTVEIVRRLIEDRHSAGFIREILKTLFFAKKERNRKQV